MIRQETTKPILVAVDFSRESESALLFAAGSAGISYGTPIVVLHVAHEPAHKPGFYDRRGLNESMLPIEDLARRMLNEFMAEVRGQHPAVAQLQSVREEIVSGLPETRIPELARKIGAQLIVIGCNDRGTLGKLFFGSVSDQVVRKSEIPVKVVHSEGITEEDTLSTKEISYEQPRSAGWLRNQLGLG